MRKTVTVHTGLFWTINLSSAEIPSNLLNLVDRFVSTGSCGLVPVYWIDWRVISNAKTAPRSFGGYQFASLEAYANSAAYRRVHKTRECTKLEHRLIRRRRWRTGTEVSHIFGSKIKTVPQEAGKLKIHFHAGYLRWPSSSLYPRAWHWSVRALLGRS